MDEDDDGNEDGDGDEDEVEPSEPHDPSIELRGTDLRELVIECLDNGNVNIPTYARARGDQRHVTAPQMEACLRSGALTTESCDVNKWRYRASKQGINLIFTFDIDGDGNILVVVTTWRKQ